MNARNPFYGWLAALSVCAAVLVGVEGASRPAVAAEGSSLAAQLQDEFAAIAAKVNPTVVNVDVVKPIEEPQYQYWEFPGPGMPIPPELRRFFNSPEGPGVQPRRRGAQQQPPQQPKAMGVGSGVVIDAEKGYILTNNHIVEGATEIGATLMDGERNEAKLVGADPRTDLAVIQIKATGLRQIEWGDSDALKPGHIVLAFGEPEGLRYTVTQGIVSAVNRANLGIIGAPGGITGYEDFIQTDAAINPGNSGGPLTDISGKLIGINAAIATSGAPQFMGIGFAIPSNLARKIAAQLIEHGEVIRGWIGVGIADLSDRNRFPTKEDRDIAAKFGKDTVGAYVASVEPGQPAEKAGLKRGDVITRYGSTDLKNVQQFRGLVADTAPGTKVDITVLRIVDDKPEKQIVAIEIARQPERLTSAQGPEGVVTTDIGMTVQTLTPDIAQQIGYGQGEKGVVVTDVADGSRAARADIEPGDVISEVDFKGDKMKIESGGDFAAALNRVGDGPFVVLRKREGKTALVTIR